ncbi:hypothetical protein FRC0160_02070 [Corynebacterium diphtheriae]|nr:hypothetical protein FRC0160_02070 [Corynebacterium diphtheriae]
MFLSKLQIIQDGKQLAENLGLRGLDADLAFAVGAASIVSVFGAKALQILGTLGEL